VVGELDAPEALTLKKESPETGMTYVVGTQPAIELRTLDFPFLKHDCCLRFEVFTPVTMKNGVFWDVTPCGPCKNRRFIGT
jgi:hypothetical protein